MQHIMPSETILIVIGSSLLKIKLNIMQLKYKCYDLICHLLRGLMDVLTMLRWMGMMDVIVDNICRCSTMSQQSSHHKCSGHNCAALDHNGNTIQVQVLT